MRLKVTVETPGGVETASLVAGRRYSLTMRDGRAETGVFEQASWSPVDGRVFLFLRSDSGTLVGFDERAVVDAVEEWWREPIDRVEAFRG